MTAHTIRFVALPALVLLVQAARVSAIEPLVFKDASGGELPYRWHEPTSQVPGRTYPLVLFLHGAGERGDDNKAQLKHGVTDIIRWSEENGEPFFLAAPQCPVELWWAAVNMETKELSPAAPATPPMKHVIALLDELVKTHPVDPRRIYLTGLSMGGFGTWFLLGEMPGRFAAAVPICGGGDPAQAGKFKDVPIWAFHGAKDPVVPVARTQAMIEALEKAGGKPKFTDYPEAGHDSWTETYRDAEMLGWMFAQGKAE